MYKKIKRVVVSGIISFIFGLSLAFSTNSKLIIEIGGLVMTVSFVTTILPLIFGPINNALAKKYPLDKTQLKRFLVKVRDNKLKNKIARLYDIQASILFVFWLGLYLPYIILIPLSKFSYFSVKVALMVLPLFALIGVAGLISDVVIFILIKTNFKKEDKLILKYISILIKYIGIRRKSWVLGNNEVPSELVPRYDVDKVNRILYIGATISMLILLLLVLFI